MSQLVAGSEPAEIAQLAGLAKAGALRSFVAVERTAERGFDLLVLDQTGRLLSLVGKRSVEARRFRTLDALAAVIRSISQPHAAVFRVALATAVGYSPHAAAMAAFAARGINNNE